MKQILWGAFLLAVLGLWSLFSAWKGQVEHGAVAFDLSPDGHRIVFSSADGDLYLFRLGTSSVERLTQTPVIETHPDFSPDGQHLAYSAADAGDGASHIFTRSLDGKEVKRLTAGGDASDVMPSYSPDGTRIVFARARRHRPYSMGGRTWDRYDLFVMGRDGSGPRRVTRQDYYRLVRPRFLDADTVLYSAIGTYPETTYSPYRIDLRSGRTAPLPTGRPAMNGLQAVGDQLVASRDGKSIAFVSDRDEPFSYDLYLLDRAGNTPHSLGVTRVSRFNANPVFAPDGKRVFFLAGTERNVGSRPIFSLWQVETDGTGLSRIADSSLFTAPLTWKPGGT